MTGVPAPRDLGNRVEAAYWSLAGRPGQPVLLSALRPLLDGATRTELDAVLVRMHGDRVIALAPASCQRALRPVDRDAAVYCAGRPWYCIAINTLPGGSGG